MLLLVHTVLLSCRSMVDPAHGRPKATASYWHRIPLRARRNRGPGRTRQQQAPAPARAGVLRPAGGGHGRDGAEGRALVGLGGSCPHKFAPFSRDEILIS